MTPLNDLLRDLFLSGVELSIEDGKLRVRAPDGVLAKDALETLRRHKEEIVSLLPDFRFEVPLSIGQEGLWSIQKNSPESVAYNVGIALHIESETDPGPALRSALQKLVNRHLLLRTTYTEIDGSPRQVVRGYRDIDLLEIDAQHLSLAEIVSAASAIHLRPFDLEAEYGFRACLFRRGPRESVLLLCVHHIAIDGWSLRRLVDELLRLYEADGRANPLPPVKHTYHEFVRLQREVLASRGEELRRAWMEELAGAPLALDLPVDRPRPPMQTFRGATLLRPMDPSLVKKLRALAREQGATLYTIFLAASQVLLHRYCGQEDICIGSAAAVRDRESIAEVLGYMVNIIPLRTRLSATEPPNFLAFLEETRKTVLRALERQDYPFLRLVQDVLDRRDPARPPVVQALFSYQRTQLLGEAAVALIAGKTVQVLGTRIRLIPLPQQISEFELIVEITEHAAESFELGIRYNSDLFDAATIERLAGHFTTLLAGIVSEPSRPVSELPLLTEREREQLLVEWNRTEVPFSSGACIHELFEAQVDRTPDAMAIVDLCGQPAGSRGIPITYRELDRRANQLAHRLRRLGVGPEVLVGLFMERSTDLIIGLLGILKAGGAFVPLDLEHPRKRLRFLLQDTNVSVVLTQGSLVSKLPETSAQVVDFEQGFAGEPEHRLASGAGPSNLAYIMYTSGSTGEPNGALIEHRGLCNVVEVTLPLMEIGPGSRLGHATAFNFDGATGPLFWMLVAGGTVYLAPRDPDFLGPPLVEMLEREGITQIFMVPAMLAALPEAKLPAMRAMAIGGERVSAELVARWANGSDRFVCIYGPTEVTVFSTAVRCVADERDPAIGRPLGNLQAYILDKWQQPVPPGVIGELYLGGVGVARGYHNRPELTARKFIQNPFGAGRLYRTGDLVRYRMTDGTPPLIDFIGRVDNQIKLHGQRIELGEIQSALRACEGVRDAVVIVQGGTAGAPARLLAYVTPATSAAGLESQREQIASWETMYDQIGDGEVGGSDPAGDSGSAYDPMLDIRGWKSSYTGQDIPAAEMRVWAESTVARILSLAPKEVLEIGFGTGMLLSRIAPRVRRYRGTDLSRYALAQFEVLKAHLPSLAHVTVSQQPAHDFSGLSGEQFDTVILNSVVQYFPSVDYLLQVLEGILGLMGKAGSIFLGDIRHLGLLETYHTAVEYHRAGPAVSRRELRARVQRGLLNENELVLHPRFFTALMTRFPQIVDVEVMPKRGAFKNELTLFRYDVTLRIGTPPVKETEILWRDVVGEGLSLTEVRNFVATAEPGSTLGLRGIPNARLQRENALQHWMCEEEAPNSERFTETPFESEAWEPESLFALLDEQRCQVRVSWAAGRSDGSLDALVTVGTQPGPRFPPEPWVTPPRWKELANDPLLGRAHRELAGVLHRELSEVLPAYMVPAAIVVLPALPLNINGKVDIRALPPPVTSSETTEFAEPRTDIERKLAQVWCKVLGLPRVGVHDSFFDLGGDSILSIQIVSKAQALGVTLRTSQIFEHQTIAKLAAVASTEGRQTDQGAVSGPVPLTPIQRWFFEQERPLPGHFNQAVLLETPAHLDLELLRRALRHVLAHHDALRMRFTRHGSAWTQECLAAQDEVAIESVDLSVLSASQRKAAIERTAARLHASLDLSAGPLTRVALFRIGGNEPDRLLWIIHHLVVDAVSWQVLIPDLATAYHQIAAGQAAKLPAKTTSFKRWAERLVQYAGEASFDEERAICALEPPAPLPVDRPAGRNEQGLAAEVRVELSAEQTRSLLGDALSPYKLRVEEILLTALAQSVAHLTGRPDVFIDLEGHGREDLFEDVDLSRTVGWFTAIFPVCFHLPGDDEAASLISVKEQLRGVPRRGIGYGLLHYLRKEGEALRWPKPEISFNYLGRLSYLGQTEGEIDAPLKLRFAPESLAGFDAGAGPRGHVLEINALINGDRLLVSFGYSRDLHDAATVERLAADFVACAGRLIEHCLLPGVGAQTPSDFPLARLPRTELRQLLASIDKGVRARIEAIYPLTPLQQGMLFHTRTADSKSVYSIHWVFTIQNALNVAAFRSAWERVVKQHPVLRSCFFFEGLSEPVQVVLREVPLPWEEQDLRSDPDKEARFQRLNTEIAARGVPLDVAPVLRLWLFRMGDERYELVWHSHHVLLDGWSVGIILRGVLETYRATVDGRPPSELAAGSYERYVKWLSTRRQERSEAYWRSVLHGFEAPTPLVGSRPCGASKEGHPVHKVHLGVDLTARLKAAAEAQRLTLSTIIEGAWALLLCCYTGLDDVLFGTMVSGREVDVPGIGDTVGLFINTLPTRVRLDGDQDVWSWLKALQAEQLKAREHQHIPLVELQRYTKVPGGTQLFQSIVVFENYPLDRELLNAAGLSMENWSWSNPTHYPLVVGALPDADLPLTFDYDPALLDAATIHRMAGHMVQILRGMAGAKAPRLREISLLDEEERQRLLIEWNRTEAPFSSEACIHELFEAQADRNPDAVAVVDLCSQGAVSRGPAITYGELEQRANKVAHRLRAHGVRPETLVAVFLPRGADLIIALLGILKAGGAVVVLDPEHPRKRIEGLLTDTAAQAVITRGPLISALPETGAHLFNFDEDFANQPSHRPAKSARPEHLAYVLYTSGSTGTPNGVLIEHRGLVNSTEAHIRILNTGPGARLLHMLSFNFDAAMAHLFDTIGAGATLYLAPRAGDFLGQELIDLIDREKITHTALVPSMLAALPDAEVPSLHTLAVGGEKSSAKLVARWGRTRRFINVYGPTEVSILATSSYCVPDGKTPSIGRPIANISAFVVDRFGKLAPPGTIGELWLGGVGVARGYLNSPELSARKFIENPFLKDKGRVYRTGDLVRYRMTDSGPPVLEFVGRADAQVKLRGQRIELAEVESALRAIPEVRDAVVVIKNAEEAEHARLVGYVTPASLSRNQHCPPAAPTHFSNLAHDPLQAQAHRELSVTVRKALGETLPAHLIPSAIIVLPALPLTPSGKVDARALPSPEDWQGAQTETAEPRNDVERKLAELFCSVLGLSRVGIHDNFFDLGGHSLLSVKLMSRLEAELGQKLPLSALFQAPTVELLAQRMMGHPAPAASKSAILTPIQPYGDRLPVLFFAPFGFHAVYFHELGRRLGADQPFYLLHPVDIAAAFPNIGSVGELAARIAGDIEEMWPHGPYVLSGHSAGVLLALPIAAELEARGHSTTLVNMDMSAPRPGRKPPLHGEPRPDDWLERMVLDHVPKSPYKGRLLLLSALEAGAEGRRVSMAGWQEICTHPVQLFTVPGTHLTMLEAPHLGAIVEHLRQATHEAREREVFPVKWENLEEAQQMWLLDEAHSLGQMSPLDFELRVRPMVAGQSRACALYGLPMAIEPKLIHSFLYQKLLFTDMPAEDFAAALQRSDQAVRLVSRELAGRWEKEWLPEIKAHLATLTAFDPSSATLGALLEQLKTVQHTLLRLWEVHFELLYPVFVALADFEETYRDLFPDAKPLDVYALVSGLPNKTLEANLSIWRLGRDAAGNPALRALLCTTELAELPARLAETTEGRALWDEIKRHLGTYGERSDDLYIDKPTWIEDPTPVLRSLRQAALSPSRDLLSELRKKAEDREARLADIRTSLASHPRAVVAEFEDLLLAAQMATVLSEDHHFWLDCKITYHARRVALEIGRRLAASAVLENPGDVFALTLAELSARNADAVTDVSELRAAIAARRSDAALFTGVTPPPVLGVPHAFPAGESALMNASFKFNGGFVGRPEKAGELRGMPGSGGIVRGPVRIVRTLAEAGVLRPGDILIAPATLPAWTPFFATAAAVVTSVGGVLSHAAVVAREYGIPAVVGARGATEAFRDGQIVEVDGDNGIVRPIAQ